MKYHEDCHKCNIDLFRFCEFLYALTKGMNEDVWNYHALDKHRKTVKDKIAEGMEIWDDPVQDVAALRRNVKSYNVIIKNHTQYTEARFQAIALCSASGRIKGESSEISDIRSVHLSPLHARLATAFKEKRKKGGNQHQGPGINS